MTLRLHGKLESGQTQLFQVHDFANAAAAIRWADLRQSQYCESKHGGRKSTRQYRVPHAFPQADFYSTKTSYIRKLVLSRQCSNLYSRRSLSGAALLQCCRRCTKSYSLPADGGKPPSAAIAHPTKSCDSLALYAHQGTVAVGLTA